MSETVIRVENLSKRYRLGLIGTTTLASDLNRWWAKLRGKPDPTLKIGQEDLTNRDGDYVWAMKDASFEVKQGEILGVIGRNGAGKSTLLKIITRITAPTSGVVKVKGRVASLLEVGTGFHPELTGRENIFLNGAILGMTKAEIRQRFDEIVAFAEIEKFIDTPVKRYSSGMYVRLAFAIAAHLEPEILLVDEVLAVGDIGFQKKCLGKMGQVASEGRTILFVSHNMSAVIELCNRGILLEAGQAVLDASIKQVVSAHTARGNSSAEVDLEALPRTRPRHYSVLKRLTLLDESYSQNTTFYMNSPFIARIEIDCLRPMKNAEVGLQVSSQYGTAIHYFTSTWEGLYCDLEPGRYIFQVVVPELLLYPGQYQLGLWVLREGQMSDDNIQNITYFDVLKGDKTHLPATIEKYTYSGSEVYSPCKWKMQRLKAEEQEPNDDTSVLLMTSKLQQTS
jgi:lipopolysaccharide transport system ATP-binding protein